jgi:hypothetical protein
MIRKIKYTNLEEKYRITSTLLPQQQNLTKILAMYEHEEKFKNYEKDIKKYEKIINIMGEEDKKKPVARKDILKYKNRDNRFNSIKRAYMNKMITKEEYTKLKMQEQQLKEKFEVTKKKYNINEEEKNLSLNTRTYSYYKSFKESIIELYYDVTKEEVKNINDFIKALKIFEKKINPNLKIFKEILSESTYERRTKGKVLKKLFLDINNIK